MEIRTFPAFRSRGARLIDAALPIEREWATMELFLIIYLSFSLLGLIPSGLSFSI